jgi:VWFA-related protein
MTYVVADFSRAVAQSQATFRANVAAVNLDVAVTRGGKPVRGLTAADFILTDSGATQRIDSAALETLPLSVFLVLDTSGSVAGDKLRNLVAASRSLVGALKPGDRLSLVTFADRVAVRIPLTGDAAALRSAFDDISAGGQTSLRDAIFAALQLLPADRTRPVVLVFSDGRDTASWLSASAVLDAVRRSGVVIHAVELVDEETSRFVGELVAASGGRRWSATSAVRLTSLFTDALDEMRSRYLLTYTPTNADRAGWHPLTVKLARVRADVTSRPGYQVPAR